MQTLAKVLCTVGSVALVVVPSALGEPQNPAKAKVALISITLDQSVAKKEAKGGSTEMATFFAATDDSAPAGNFYFTNASESDQRDFQTKLGDVGNEPNFQSIKKLLESNLWSALNKVGHEKGEGGIEIAVALQIVPGPWRNALEFPLGTAIDGVIIRPRVTLKDPVKKTERKIDVNGYLVPFKAASIEKALQAISGWTVEKIQAKDE